jgi:hypothetical protein
MSKYVLWVIQISTHFSIICDAVSDNKWQNNLRITIFYTLPKWCLPYQQNAERAGYDR